MKFKVLMAATVSQTLTDVLERLLMVEAVNTSTTSVNFYETVLRKILKDCHFRLCIVTFSP